MRWTARKPGANRRRKLPRRHQARRRPSHHPGALRLDAAAGAANGSVAAGPHAAAFPASAGRPAKPSADRRRGPSAPTAAARTPPAARWAAAGLRQPAPAPGAVGPPRPSRDLLPACIPAPRLDRRLQPRARTAHSPMRRSSPPRGRAPASARAGRAVGRLWRPSPAGRAARQRLLRGGAHCPRQHRRADPAAMSGRGIAHRGDGFLTRALTVRLRAPNGGFSVEPATPRRNR